MYRLITMGNKTFAVELLTSGRSAEDELNEMQDYVNDDYEPHIIGEELFNELIEAGTIQLITRDYL